MDILKQIISMDKEAVKRCEEEVAKERKVLEESGAHAAAEREKALEERKKAFVEYKASETAKLDAKLARADDYRAEQCKKLDDAFNAGKARWKDEIISRITEG